MKVGVAGCDHQQLRSSPLSEVIRRRDFTCGDFNGRHELTRWQRTGSETFVEGEGERRLNYSHHTPSISG